MKSVFITETMAITTSLVAIVMISIAIGSLLPVGMKYVGIDPAHSSTSIQVIMDILGVVSTEKYPCFVVDTTLSVVLMFSYNFFADDHCACKQAICWLGVQMVGSMTSLMLLPEKRDVFHECR